MPNLDWKHYSLIALALAVLAAWGSREHTWTKTTEQYQTEQTRLTKSLAQLRTENESLQRSTEEVETTEPMVIKVNGKDQVVMVTRKTSKTIETAMRTATEQLNSLTTQVTDLKVKLSLKETEVTKSAPRWYAGLDWQPLQGQGPSAFSPQLGINIGTLTIYAAHPLALEFAPHVGVGLRF